MVVAAVGIAILLISVVGAVLWARGSAADQPRQAKILLFFLYFWLLAFLQIIIAAIGYAIFAN